MIMVISALKFSRPCLSIVQKNFKWVWHRILYILYMFFKKEQGNKNNSSQGSPPSYHFLLIFSPVLDPWQTQALLKGITWIIFFLSFFHVFIIHCNLFLAGIFCLVPKLSMISPQARRVNYYLILLITCIYMLPTLAIKTHFAYIVHIIHAYGIRIGHKIRV